MPETAVKQATVVVYGLTMPVTHEVFYVGITDNLKRRFGNHVAVAKMTNGKGTSGEKHMLTIYNLLEKGMCPGVVVLEATDRESAPELERRWQRVLIERGEPLQNARIKSLSKQDIYTAFGVNVELMTLAQVAESRLRQYGDDATARLIRNALNKALAVVPPDAA